VDLRHENKSPHAGLEKCKKQLRGGGGKGQKKATGRRGGIGGTGKVFSKNLVFLQGRERGACSERTKKNRSFKKTVSRKKSKTETPLFQGAGSRWERGGHVAIDSLEGKH